MNPPTFKGVKLVGIQYKPQYSQLIAASVTRGDFCSLVREPFNPHDKAAVMVVTQDTLIAYVERDVAAELATWMDQGIPYHAEIRRNMGKFIIANLVPNPPKPKQATKTAFLEDIQ